MNENSYKFDSNDIESYISHLKSLENFDNLLEDNNENFGQFLNYFSKIVFERNKCIEIVSKTKIYEFLSSLLQYFCSIRSAIDFKSCTKKNNSDFNRSEKILYYLKDLNAILNMVFSYSIEARIYFNENIVNLKTFMIFLNDIEFILEFTKYSSEFDGFINTIYYLAESSNDFKHNWESLNLTKIVLEFAKSIPNWSFVAYAIIALIASDQEMEKIDELDEILSKFIHLTIECIRNPAYVYPKQFQDCSESVNANIRAISGKNGFVYLIDYYLNTLYGFAINDKFREKIYFYSDLADSVKFLVKDGNDVEKFYAIKIFAQLSFNENIKKDLLNDKQFLELIKEIKSVDNFDYQKLKLIISDFDWVLNKFDRESKTTYQKDNHIMISYNTGSRETCLNIKNELERIGHKIWIDVDEIHGSSLDSMAKAIENSAIVLMCVSEKYRQSINCQAEAQYAFRLNKVIIPLIMQPEYYKVSGWLGIIIGDKIFVDFTKYTFEQSMKRLKNQINLLLDKNNNVDSKSMIFKEITHGPKDWNEEEVKTWFYQNEILGIFDILKPLNGGILFQLYELKIFSPEFFYKSLTSKECVDIKIVSVFTYNLVKLFENSNC